MRASITVSVGDIIRGMSRQERVQFVKELDLAMADWDATLDLIAHFETQRQEYLAECAESGEDIDERAKVLVQDVIDAAVAEEREACMVEVESEIADATKGSIIVNNSTWRLSNALERIRARGAK